MFHKLVRVHLGAKIFLEPMHSFSEFTVHELFEEPKYLHSITAYDTVYINFSFADQNSL